MSVSAQGNHERDFVRPHSFALVPKVKACYRAYLQTPATLPVAQQMQQAKCVHARMQQSGWRKPAGKA